MRYTVLLALAVSLASCSQPNDRICATPVALDPSGSSSQTVKTQGCIHRWSYRLAKSTDPSDRVAEAVLGACEDAIKLDIFDKRAKLQSAFEQSEAGKSDDYYQGQRAMTRDGELTMHFDTQKGWVFDTHDDNERMLQEYRRIALFHVVQARAGNCSVP